MALKYKRILLKLSGEVLKGSSDSCHDETILAEVAQPFDAREAIRLMGQGTVALFAGDTGNPFFSTDSGADLRAAEIGADALLKATKVDGIYSADPATGRIAESDGFAWDYLAGSNLKSKLTYPNEAVVTWSYEPHRDLLTAVTNATYSTYVYTNDLLGRRIAKNDEQYGYNIRNELISANDLSYAYDDVGNRTTAEGKTYTANALNQYTQIDDFAPQYDADGNQTLIQTSSGIWSVVYNAENRPIRWQSGDTVITMAFDRMGRRVEMRTVKDGAETLQRFVYDNYLCVQQLRGADNALFHSYVWDPTEPIATRPLVLRDISNSLFYYFHDANKNVVNLADSTKVHVCHYIYSPYGAQTLLPTSTLLLDNPLLFSSEFYNDVLDLVYYNYRHYGIWGGRWIGRDPLEEIYANLYDFIGNAPLSKTDFLGLVRCCGDTPYNPSKECCVNNREILKKVDTCVAEIHLGHFGGRTQEELRNDCGNHSTQQHQKFLKENMFVTKAYITCFAQTTNEIRKASGEIITPSYFGARGTASVYPFPSPNIPSEQHVNTALEREIKNAIRRLAELKNARCCKNVKIEFSPLTSSGDDSSVNKWFKHPANRMMMQNAQLNLSKNVKAEQNKIRRSK